MQQVIRLVQTGRDSDAKHLAPFLSNRHELSVAPNSLLLRDTRIVFPCSLQQSMVRIAHEGHQGFVKTAALLRERVWFPRMRTMVDDTIKDCAEC